MMNKNIMPVLSPDFFNEFHCVAADCRHNCCVHPWKIFIDKKNYKQVRGLKEPKWLADNLGGYIKRNPTGTGDGDYALAVFNERGCAFQTEDGLCRLQMDAGAQYLSKTCQVYPRQYSYLVTQYATRAQKECSLTISCEEVARMLLHKPEPIQFVTTQQEYNPANFRNESKSASSYIMDKGDRPMLEHYNRVRAICIALLQNRDYRIEQRMILLLMYLDKLAQAERDKAEAEVPQITDTFVAAVDARLYDALLASGGGAVSSTYFSNMASVIAFSDIIKQRNRIVQQCDVNIGTVTYAVRRENCHAFTADKEHFLEHLMVTELFGKSLPFKTDRSIFDCMEYLAAIFTIFRFMLGAYLGDARDLPETELIDFMAYFGKSVLHSSSSFDRNITLLKENGMDTLPHLMSIVIG